MFLSGWKWKTKKVMIPYPFPPILWIKERFIGLTDQGKYRRKKEKKERKKDTVRTQTKLNVSQYNLKMLPQ